MKHSNGLCSVHWPSYAIDHANEAAAGVPNRVMEWASYIERASGELYFTTANFKTPGAAWGEAKFYGANGDEYLYYPGRSAANASFSIGGRSDIPIESARLKHVRDGFEDHEWLTILERTEGVSSCWSRSRRSLRTPGRLKTTRRRCSQPGLRSAQRLRRHC